MYLASEAAIVRWADDSLALDIRLQHDLIAVVTITNLTDSQLIVPNPLLVPGSSLNSYEVLDSSGVSLAPSTPHVDWFCKGIPVIPLKAQRSHSEALDLRRAFPSLGVGDYQFSFHYRAEPCSRATWQGEITLEPIAFTVAQ
jgi:hypothetical protein